MDFTFKTYENLLNTLLMRDFSFMTYSQYVEAKVREENKAKVEDKVEFTEPPQSTVHHSPITDHRSPFTIH